MNPNMTELVSIMFWLLIELWNGLQIDLTDKIIEAQTFDAFFGRIAQCCSVGIFNHCHGQFIIFVDCSQFCGTHVEIGFIAQFVFFIGE